ncbi:response regulator [Chitinophaga agrisoli]|uniref:histidine kinase n=1 Tax=Chitinophaga agrisoli TaxID=2607653 RepID=A0A5B2VGJ9_9BACT|nr:hybrid sensor histidine kinase/response regulator [Chitinophaga agrisoli]KAA2238693.1 response regulator [Chitinophaga agrisoli]
MTLLTRLVRNGAADADEITGHGVIAVNRFSLVAFVLTCCFGVLFYLLTGELKVWIATFTEAGALIVVLALNKARKYVAASFSFIITVNASLIYFSGILAAIIEVHLAFLLLFGASLLFFREDKYRVASIIITAITVGICEYNYSYPFITPLLNSEGEQQLLRWGARPGIILLDALVIWYYKKNNEALVKSLTKRTEELEAANTSKNFFIRVTNHELKGPLNAIHEISQTLLLHDEVEEHPVLKPLAEDLYAASNTAMQEVSNVLDMSQIEAGKINNIENTPFNIRLLLTNLCKVHQYSANRKQVYIVTEFHEQLPAQVVSDKAKLTKVIRNLLVNAVKFTANKSKVILRAYVKDAQLHISVKDQGKGIPPDRLRTIFEAFETEQNSLMEGSGLGLYITRHFVALLGGHITVHSSPKDGTTFTIQLPLRTAREEALQGGVATAADTAFYRGKRILICEDNLMSQQYLARFLERNGCTIFVAENGEAGMAIAEREPLDLAIVDSHMPVMSGRDTITHIRQHPQLRQLPVIVLSGDAYKGEDEELLMAGANEYLLKPVDFKTLGEVMRKYLTSPIAGFFPPPAQAI